MKQFNYRSINRGHLSHLIADHLFSDTTKLIFDAKTGKHIGYIQDAKVIEFPTEDETVIELPPDNNDQQLTLF